MLLNSFEASLQIDMNREHINTMCAQVAEEREQGVDLFIMRKKKYNDFRARASTEQMLQLFGQKSINQYNNLVEIKDQLSGIFKSN